MAWTCLGGSAGLTLMPPRVTGATAAPPTPLEWTLHPERRQVSGPGDTAGTRARAPALRHTPRLLWAPRSSRAAAASSAFTHASCSVDSIHMQGVGGTHVHGSSKKDSPSVPHAKGTVGKR